MWKHEGGGVQCYLGKAWHDGCVVFLDDVAYRKKPAEPVREAVTLFVSPLSDGQWKTFGPVNQHLATHRITFETVDGEMDCSSIKAEKL